MASAFTHVVVGGAIGSLAPAGVSPWRAGLILGALSAAPDLDVVGFEIGIRYAHPLGHRGFSHSLPFAALVAPAAAWLCAPDAPLRSRRFWILTGLAFAAIGSHGLLDTFTDGGLGIGLLIPFNDVRYFAPVRPIPVSPIPASEFFKPEGARILAIEMALVWAPGLLGLAVVRRVLGFGAQSSSAESPRSTKAPPSQDPSGMSR